MRTLELCDRTGLLEEGLFWAMLTVLSVNFVLSTNKEAGKMQQTHTQTDIDSSIGEKPTDQSGRSLR